ncbi:hypothetical protein BpHYR1_035745 [Brachionus plicatilis]|uniref:Uncharacterized protein n=1 Tax=Brachionus plicatilis TaxID=10195 RepID=A0A3M7SSX3_BRAPC|nr:hypothetical protein BpHYR1_035745 [Brachionus plicatilis]
MQRRVYSFFIKKAGVASRDPGQCPGLEIRDNQFMQFFKNFIQPFDIIDQLMISILYLTNLKRLSQTNEEMNKMNNMNKMSNMNKISNMNNTSNMNNMSKMNNMRRALT